MGAPKGNTNALKHGLYARHFNPQDQAGLRNMTPEDYHYEINLMRVAIQRLFDIQTRLHALVDESLRLNQPCDVEPLSKISNSLSLAMTALSSMARTHALFNGTDTSINDALENALNGMAIFIDNKYLIESRSDAEDQQEVLVE